jgi:hypothetical protein
LSGRSTDPDNELLDERGRERPRPKTASGSDESRGAAAEEQPTRTEADDEATRMIG